MKKYRIVYDTKLGLCVSGCKVSSHRNISQLGTCFPAWHLRDREMLFGDEGEGLPGKCLDLYDDKSRTYKHLLYPTKLTRFVRS